MLTPSSSLSHLKYGGMDLSFALFMMNLRHMGKNAISSYLKDAKGTAYIVDESTSPKLKNAINRIWNAFKDWEAIHYLILHTKINLDGLVHMTGICL